MNIVLTRRTLAILKEKNKIVKSFPLILRKRLPQKISLIEVTEKESQRINLLYRRKDKPTNVLSFRYSNAYGEILVCPEVIWREAKAEGNPQGYQMTWMIVHGMIHLAGVHHEKSKTAERTFLQIEKDTLKRIFNS